MSAQPVAEPCVGESEKAQTSLRLNQQLVSAIEDCKEGAAIAAILAGADVNKVNKHLGTPLARAMYHGLARVVDCLLLHGANPIRRNERFIESYWQYLNGSIPRGQSTFPQMRDSLICHGAEVDYANEKVRAAQQVLQSAQLDLHIAQRRMAELLKARAKSDPAFAAWLAKQATIPQPPYSG